MHWRKKKPKPSCLDIMASPSHMHIKCKVSEFPLDVPFTLRVNLHVEDLQSAPSSSDVAKRTEEIVFWENSPKMGHLDSVAFLSG